jgi:hypothetical protein
MRRVCPPVRDTAETFVPVLLQNLQKTGTIDWAVGEARRAVERQPDFYAPVLFHRLKSGRIWYGDDDIAADQDGINWAALLDHIQGGDGTVLLGSGLLEPYVGSQAELATRLALKFGYPFSEKERDDIAMVTQYVSAVRTRRIMQQEVLREMARQLLRHHGQSVTELLRGATLEDRIRQGGLDQELSWMLETVWESRRQSEHEPYAVLANLPFKAYVTTNPDHLLEKALEKKRAFVWRCGRNGPRAGLRKTPPTRDEPLLAYVYGSLRDPDTLVLTEDDYFEYLIEAAGSDTAPVKTMNRVFLESALIFLGFRLHEWDFRVFFRRLKQMSGWEQHKNFSHVAVQLDPSSAGGAATSQEVRRFLKNFIESDRIEIFEGSVEQFVRSLNRRLGARGAGG